MRQAMEDGISEVLSSVVDDVSHAVNRNVGGAQLLQELLGAPWLHALLQMYECLLQFKNLTPGPILPYASGLSHEIMTVIQKGHRPSAEARELYGLLGSPHMQALLSSHDSVAQSDYGPVLPPLPDDLPEDEEAVRIVCLVKNNQPLGATIRRDEDTGGIYIARVIHGGLADRSGLLHPGDLVVEVNGHPVGGLDPEQVIQMLIHSQGTILFKVIPKAAQSSSSQKPVYMRAMVDYFPQQDSSIPCPDAGMAFSRGDLLEVVDQSDGQWWQARKLPCAVSCAGLIPSASMLKSKHREQWWCEPLQVHTCIRPCEDAAASSSSSSSLLSPTSRHRRTIQHMQITNARSQIWKKLILMRPTLT
ncbi:MAGUK p55 subfamily member 4-like isoform X5 [Scophthalmus maximus]|uniref:MAGUK p55 subfamily member 4-like isoform X5 n=1 Tax=Scophthalmus maximus TaxID=52904 RepID=UPI001FA8C49A|nr:MAGUK p55 subfamily member 4-like isoform X5 [Scophthalmus maximus]